MTGKAAFFAGLLLSVPVAQAQIGVSDGIGLYFDESASVLCTYTAAPFQSVTAYLCATQISDPVGIAGWRSHPIAVSGSNLVAPTWTIPYAGTLGGDADCSWVTDVLPPLPAAPAIVLMVMHAYVFLPGVPIYFYLDGCADDTAWPHNPTYQPASGTPERLPLHQLWGPYGCMVGMINECPTPGATSTWGGVKALYD